MLATGTVSSFWYMWEYTLNGGSVFWLQCILWVVFHRIVWHDGERLGMDVHFLPRSPAHVRPARRFLDWLCGWLGQSQGKDHYQVSCFLCCVCGVTFLCDVSHTERFTCPDVYHYYIMILYYFLLLVCLFLSLLIVLVWLLQSPCTL